MTEAEIREAQARIRIAEIVATLDLKWKSPPSRPVFEQGRLSPEEEAIFRKLPAFAGSGREKQGFE